MPKRASKNEDEFQIARRTLDTIDPDAEPAKPTERKKNPAAVALGKLGGSKGGKARAANLTAAKRRAIAKKAAQARWQRKSS